VREVISSRRNPNNMGKGSLQLVNLLADEYSGRILSLTYFQPRCVQEICSLSGIPIAVAYRRVADLEASGLLYCNKIETSPSGKKSKYYSCHVDMARLTFRDGRFEVEVEWKDRSMEKVPLPLSRSKIGSA